jgi:mono/diheme cytochrome c family protein
MHEHFPWLPLALLGFLAGCSGGGSGAPPPPAEDHPAQGTGARLYDVNCAPCHGPDSRGIPGVYPSLVGSPVVLGDPKDLTLWVMQGLRPQSLKPGRYPTVMPEYGWMKPANAAALLTYLRSNFGNSAAAVDAATVARALEPSP